MNTKYVWKIPNQVLFSSELEPRGYYLEHVFDLDHVISTGFFFRPIFGKQTKWICRSLEFFAWVFEILLKILSFSLEFWEIFRWFIESCFQICLFYLPFIFTTMCLLFHFSLNCPSFLDLFALFSALIFYQICQKLEFCAWVLSFFILKNICEVEKGLFKCNENKHDTQNTISF